MTGEQWRVFEALDAEWALVSADPAHAARVGCILRNSGVSVPKDEAGGLAGLLAGLGRHDRAHDRRLDRAHSDRWLYVLLEVASGEGADAQLAARVVVQAMLPGVVRLAQRLRRPGWDFDETAQVVVSCLYRVVRTYPRSRQRRVAANLLLETLHWASRELPVEHDFGVVLPDTEDRSDAVAESDDPVEAAFQAVLAQQAAEAGLTTAEEVSGARGELVELLVWAVESGVLPRERAQVIAVETRAGAREAAEQSGMSAAAWRQRRSRTVRQLRAVAGQWVQAA